MYMHIDRTVAKKCALHVQVHCTPHVYMCLHNVLVHVMIRLVMFLQLQQQLPSWEAILLTCTRSHRRAGSRCRTPPDWQVLSDDAYGGGGGVTMTAVTTATVADTSFPSCLCRCTTTRQQSHFESTKRKFTTYGNKKQQLVFSIGQHQCNMQT